MKIIKSVQQLKVILEEREMQEIQGRTRQEILLEQSALLTAASRAQPNIADYPFTTLNLLVRKVQFVDNTEMTITNIARLIEEVPNDKGLGHEFQRHIESCRLLLYFLDGQAGYIEEQINILKNEIKEYNEEIQKPYIARINKANLIKKDYDYLMISAKNCQMLANYF
ncbi:unnamed protein product [Paramecium sonneborni]|uniref:G domain-containing protein n=1 Tax=Paramecium sonneborni TaxID=65129 RepID=A0A8S1MBS6_9CILI|nr:unnamed protein product [Paramecium sonneborni]